MRSDLGRGGAVQSFLSSPITPASAQSPFGTSWMMTWRLVGLASACCTMASVMARTSARFCCGVRPGHIPGSINVPYTELTTADGTLKSKAELRDLFGSHALDISKPVITTCGSGITAATLMLALAAAGASHVSLYDGSWADWGAREGAPIETG